MLMASSQPSPHSHPTSPPAAPRGMEESMLDFGEIDSLADFLQEEDILINSDQWQIDVNDVNAMHSKLPPSSLLDVAHPLDNSCSSSQFTLSTSLNSFRPKLNEEPESSLGATVANARTMQYSSSDQKQELLAISHSELTAASSDEPTFPHTTAVYTASTVPVEKPNVNDVLLGRGGRNNQWSGNETLREMARTMATHYSAAPKRNKPAIAMILVQKIRALTPPGRFLKQEQAVGSWLEVDEEVAREKASQCLRDIVAAMTKHKLKNGDSSASDLFLSASASTSNLRQTSVSSLQRNSSITSSASDARHRSVASFFGNRSTVETSRMGNAEWNIPNVEHSSGDNMARFSAAGRMPPSAAARAGLALLQRGGPPNPQSGNPNGLVGSHNSSSSNVAASAMQISSGNLSDLHHSSGLASGTVYGTAPKQGHAEMASEPKEFSMRYSAPDFDGELGRPDGTNKRNAMSASAPNLGDISLFLAKRRRSAVNVQWPGENSGMQNATFGNMPSVDNAMEPVQVDIASGRPPFGGRAMSMMTLGSTGLAKNILPVDPLMLRLQALRSNMNSRTSNNTTANEIDYRDPDTIRRLSIVREQDSSSTGNFNWNAEEEAQPQSGMERTDNNLSMFASLLQQQHKTNDSFNCFSGMGAVMGDSDDNALQRWIDRMAEEEFS